MSQWSQTSNNTTKQTTIKSFFVPCKGPLKFQTSSFKSCAKQKKKRRSKERKKPNNQDDDVIIVEDAMEEPKQFSNEIIESLDCSVPLSPQIMFGDDQITTSPQVSKKKLDDTLESPSKRSKLSLSKFFSHDENNLHFLNTVETEKSPSPNTCRQSLDFSHKLTTIKIENVTGGKDDRLSCNQNCDTIEVLPTKYSQKSTKLIDMAVTKSIVESKTEDNLSKTCKMNSCSDAMITYAFSEIDIYTNDKLQVPTLKSMVDITADDNKFVLKKDDEELDDMTLMQNHLIKVKTIIKNATRPNFENLLFEDEKNLLIMFCSLSNIHQFICCKLFTHQIKWYNPVTFLQKLRNSCLKPDNVIVDEMVRILEDGGFVKTDYGSEELSPLLHLLKSEEIKQICKDFRIKHQLPKKQQIDAIVNHIKKQTSLHPAKPMINVVKSVVCNKLGAMFKITESFYNTFYKIHLMYAFGNPELEIPQGIYKFMGEIFFNNNVIPKYKTCDDIIFETPEEFAAFYKAYSYKEELLQEVGKKNSNKDAIMKLCEEIFEEFKLIINHPSDIIKITKLGFLNYFTPGSKYASALIIGIDKLSATYPAKSKLWIEELLKQDYFCIRKRSVLYARLATIYKKHYKDNESACKILVNALKDTNLLLSDICEIIYRCKSYMEKLPLSQHFEDVRHIFQRAPDIERFPSIIIEGSSVSEAPVYKHKNKQGEMEYLRVEDYAIRHYLEVKGFASGIHCEGALMNTLFHILLWDIIYMDGVAQAFISPMQRSPLDLHHANFYKARQENIDERITNIRSAWSTEELEDFIRTVWVEASHCKTLIFALELEHIVHIVKVLSRTIVADVCEKFAKHFDEFHAGLPDLVLWNDTKCKFVEVKGPGDQLSTKQKLWIQFLLDIGADVEVCHVERMGGRQ